MRKILSLTFFVLLLVPIANAQEAKTLLWEISGYGLEEPSYLYGTFHSRDNRVFRFSDSVMAKFDASEAFVMELVIDSSLMSALMGMIVMEEGYSLQKLLPQNVYDEIGKRIKDNLNVDIILLNKVKPVFIYMILSQGSLAEDRKLFLDEYFLELAQQQDKKVFGLETATEQMNALNSLSLAEQAQLLVEFAESGFKENVKMDEMVETYQQGDLQGLMEIIKSESMTGDFYQELIVNRNIRMAERLRLFIHDYPSFIAVGAGHLPGDTGVIALLRQYGYLVTPVKASYHEAESEEDRRSRGEWYELKDDEGHFSILMPDRPERIHEDVETAAGQVESRNYRAKDPASNIVFNVSYSVYPQPVELTGKGLAKELKKNLNFSRIRKSSAVNMNGQEAYEILLKANKTTDYRIVYLLHNKRLYQLMVTGSKKEVKSDKVDKFIRSFEMNH